MKISYDWLSSYFFETSRPKVEDITHGLTFHAFEIESVEKHQGDTVFDVKVTPNRGHDCLSHRGIAREVAAILDIALREDPLRRPIGLMPVTDKVSISIQEPTLCSRYTAAYIRGVKVAQSPRWLASRLEAIGQRSINNIVDATNYVMFNLGQPLHAFDAGGLKSEKGAYSIGVRRARDGEKIKALDAQEYSLNTSMLVITDEHAREPIGIAGVKGGEPAGITEKTTDIIIESANFNGVSVRKTAQALKLRTDASSRFEQVVSPELAAHGLVAAVALIHELAGGELLGYADQYPAPLPSASVSVSQKKVNTLLGTKISTDEIGRALNRLGLTHTMTETEVFTVQIPFERLDITIPEDLVEEIGRIVGLEKIPTADLPPLQGTVALNKKFYWSERIREFLVSRGFSEVFTSIFSDSGERAVLNKVGGEKPYLRTALRPGLQDALDGNVHVKELLGLSQVRIFELGDVWSKGEEFPTLALAVESVKKGKSATEFFSELCKELGISKVPALDPKALVSEVHLDDLLAQLPYPTADDELPISAAIRYEPFSKYPYIVRDVALWTPKGTRANDVLALIKQHSGELLQRIDLFDEFERDGKVSFAFRLVFQSFDRTLFDEDANERMEGVYTALKARGWEVR